jgi:hypothetical protein
VVLKLTDERLYDKETFVRIFDDTTPLQRVFHLETGLRNFQQHFVEKVVKRVINPVYYPAISVNEVIQLSLKFREHDPASVLEITAAVRFDEKGIKDPNLDDFVEPVHIESLASVEANKVFLSDIFNSDEDRYASNFRILLLLTQSAEPLKTIEANLLIPVIGVLAPASNGNG